MSKTLKPKTKRLRADNLPLRMPVSAIIAFYLLLERFNAPGWLFGVVFTFYGIVVALVLHGWFTSEYVDAFEGKR